MFLTAGIAVSISVGLLQAQTPKPATPKLAPGFLLIPGGTFQMGSADDEAGRDPDEGPVHQVAVRTFALGRTEVTRGEFASFVAATGYLTDDELSSVGCRPKPQSGPARSWRSPGYDQTDEHPVVCVSRADAQRYAAWLGKRVGATLRLPTEAEMEFALRAGGQTSHPWGSDGTIACKYGNIGDANFRKFSPGTVNAGTCDDGYTFTAPVGRFEPNKYGLLDLSGNVWKWTLDCYHPNFDGAPTDGSAWTAGACEAGVARGASFDDGPRFQRSANRVRAGLGQGAWVFGFRLVQEVSQ